MKQQTNGAKIKTAPNVWTANKYL